MDRFTRGVAQGPVPGPLPFVIVVAPLQVELSKTAGRHHASVADDLALLTPSAARTVIRATPRPAPGRVEH